MSYKELKALVGDNAEAVKVIGSLEQSANSNIERINTLEKTNGDLLGEVKNFKTGNNLVKETLGLEQLNAESLSEALTKLKSTKGDDGLTAEIDNLKSLLEKVGSEKETIVSEYEGKLSSMALNNSLRDLGIGSIASTPIVEKMILDYLRDGAVLEGDKTIYKKDGATVYDGTSIMTPQSKLEALKASPDWRPLLKPDVNSGGGSKESNNSGGSQNSTMSGDKNQRKEAIKAKFNL